jgi:hypothetical protein
MEETEQIVASVAIVDDRGAEVRHRIDKQGVKNVLE